MLYIVGTPIGNLDDLSLRQAKILSSSDVILAEDTRSAQILIQGIKERFTLTFNSNQKLISYYKEKEFEKLPEVLELLNEGKSISLITESGMPLISDPGYLLVKTIIKRQISFTVIPSPSAVVTSIVYSGFDSKQFIYLGFFPKKESEIIQTFNKIKQIKEIYPELVFVFYESPNRIKTTLLLLQNTNWNPDIAICREMTKKFEEIIRGKVTDLLTREYKGEITMIFH